MSRLLIFLVCLFIIGMVSYISSFILSFENLFTKALKQYEVVLPKLLQDKSILFYLVTFAITFITVMVITILATSIRRERIEI